MNDLIGGVVALLVLWILYLLLWSLFIGFADRKVRQGGAAMKLRNFVGSAAACALLLAGMSKQGHIGSDGRRRRAEHGRCPRRRVLYPCLLGIGVLSACSASRRPPATSARSRRGKALRAARGTTTLRRTR